MSKYLREFLIGKSLVFLLLYIFLTIILVISETTLIVQLTQIVEQYPRFDNETIIVIALTGLGIFISRTLQITSLVTIARLNAVRLSVKMYAEVCNLRISTSSDGANEILEGTNFLQPFIIAITQIIGNILIVTAIILNFLWLHNITIPLEISFIVLMYIIAIHLIRLSQRRNGKKVINLLGKRYGLFRDVISSSFTIKNYNIDNYFIDKLQTADGNIRRTQATIYLLSSAPKLVLDFALVGVILLIVTNGSLDKSIFVLLAFLGIRIIPYITQVFLNISKVSATFPIVKRFIRNIDRNNIAGHSDVTLLNSQSHIITGHSGAGKSTYLLRMFGVEKGVLIDETLFKESQEKAVLFQQKSAALNIEVETFIRLLNIDNSILLKFGLQDLKSDQMLSELSGGEVQRLWLSAAFSDERDVLIFDEPTNNLDAISRQSFFDCLKSEERTVIIVSHDDYVIDTCKRLGFSHHEL